MKTNKLRLAIASLIAIAASTTTLAAVGDAVDWYLTIYNSSWAVVSKTQFVETATSNVFIAEDVAVSGSGLTYLIHNNAWSTQYGVAVNATDTPFTLTSGTGAKSLSISADTYDVTFDLGNTTVQFDSQSSSTATMARGADLSWCTEMEAMGSSFYSHSGEQTDVFALLKEFGLTAVRLRVWVNPIAYGYGAYCNQADVIAKAKRAAAQGLDIMIDFHYSDYFADPSSQTKPTNWTSSLASTLATNITSHTTGVLQALKDEGVDVKWVQVGNETNAGMVWDTGKLSSYTANFSYYVTLSNAGYNAVKSVYPDALVLVHLAGAHDTYLYKWLDTFQTAGGLFDMIGVSHYPDYSDWNSTSSGVASNPNAASNISTLMSRYSKPVMIVETGFNSYDSGLANTVMTDLFARAGALSNCAGIFYWEPEVYGGWRPTYYINNSITAYNLGAFTSNGKISQALDAFKAPGSSSYPSGIALYDAAGTSIIGYLAMTSTDGVYSGTLTSTTDYLNFQVVDEYHNVWYRTSTSDFNTMTTGSGNNFWLDVADTYTITVDLPNSTWSYTQGTPVSDTDYWYLYSYGNWGDYDKPFTQSTTNSDEFVLENLFLTSSDLSGDALSFQIICANFTESYTYNANITALGSYTLQSTSASGAWGNSYCTAMQVGVPYTLTWNRSTHMLTIAGPPNLTLSATATTAPTYSAGYYNVTVNRHLEGGKWNMVCLPFSLDESALKYYFGSGVKLAKFTDASRQVHSANSAARRANSATGIVEFTTATTDGLDANTPYLLMPDDDVESITVANKWVAASSPSTVTQGNYSLVGTDAATTATAGNYYIDGTGAFTQATGSETVPALGAYITGAGGASLSNEGLSIKVDDVVTGIADVVVAGNEGNDRIYNLQGQAVGTTLEDLPAGIYILNHRKIVKR